MPTKRLRELGKEILKCKKCSELVKLRLYPMPYFIGKEELKAFVIGINPGPWDKAEKELLIKLNYNYRKHYDICLRKSGMGQFANWVLGLTPLTIENIFLTNIIKCTTMARRPPKKEEIQNCLPYLRVQLEEMDPDFIITLGQTPADFFNVKRLNNIYVLSDNGSKSVLVALYHPAYMKRAEKKFRGIRELVRKGWEICQSNK